MIEVIAQTLDNCPLCGSPLRFVEMANDFFVLNKKFYCPSCRQLVVAFPDQDNLDRHKQLIKGEEYGNGN